MAKAFEIVKKCFSRFLSRGKGIQSFDNSEEYWEKRYKSGGTSGSGSYDSLAVFKADVINSFVKENHLSNVIEFGCGDGNQLGYFDFEAYTGYDISPTAIAICNEKYKDDASKQFNLIKVYNNQKAELTMSLDVIYHLIEDDKYFEHMEMLFSSSSQYVIIYAWNIDQNNENGTAPHVKHRKFTSWIEANAPDFELIKNISDSKFFDKKGIEINPAEFYFFKKRPS